MSWYWPKLTDLKNSEEAAHQGAGVCFFIAGASAIGAGVSVLLDKPVLGIDAWAFVDAGIFAIAGWRIWRFSRIWAVLALAIFIIETVYKVESSSDVPAAGVYVRAVLGLALIGGVRGTFAYQSFTKKQSTASLAAGGAGSQ